MNNRSVGATWLMIASSWLADLLPVFLSVILSSLFSFLIARRIANKKIEDARDRDVEKWYKMAGKQAELARLDWEHNVNDLSPAQKSDRQVLKERAEILENHTAEGLMLNANDAVTASVYSLAAAYRHAAGLLEDDPDDLETLLEPVEKDMKRQVERIHSEVAERTDYEYDK